MDCSPVARGPVSGPDVVRNAPVDVLRMPVCVLSIPVCAVLSTGRNGPVVERRTTGMFVILPFLMRNGPRNQKSEVRYQPDLSQQLLEPQRVNLLTCNSVLGAISPDPRRGFRGG